MSEILKTELERVFRARARSIVKLRLGSGTQALSDSLRLTQALTQAHSGSYSVTVTVTQSLG